MKKMICIALIISVFMLLFPMCVLGEDEKKEISAAEKTEVKSTLNNTSKSDTFRVLDKNTKTVTEMTADDYIFGVVAAEMPALYEIEALKAQAVAAYTFACYKREQNREKDYDISTDFTTDQSFKTEADAIKGWGEKGNEYAEKIKSALGEVSGQMLVYKNKPILAVYHAISSGQTYSAKEVWGSEIAYLQSVSSAGDKLAENYISTFEFSPDEIKSRLINFLPQDLADKPLLSDIKRLHSGLVDSVKFFGEEIKGSKFREAFELPSCNFEYKSEDGKYIFTCYGYGHGVGMSQKGADYLAKQGYSYQEILSHYYVGAALSKGK